MPQSTREPSFAPPATTIDEGLPTVAVLGNPNAGKTTLFNRLTGLRQKVANYPGVTVEKKEGYLRAGRRRIRLIDLPGTYSLAAHSLDEIVTVDVLLGQQRGEARPDVVLHVVDASNLERNLYLFSQLVDLGVRVVIALNMTDVAERQGVRVDPDALSKRLGVPVVPTQGHRGIGLDQLRSVLEEALDRPENAAPRLERVRLSVEVEESLDGLHAKWAPRLRDRSGRDLHRFELLRALVDEHGYALERLVSILGHELAADLTRARERATRERPLPALEARARYEWVRAHTEGVSVRAAEEKVDLSERIDRVLTHRFFGLVVFFVVMAIVFQSIFTWAEPLMGAVEGVFESLGSWASGVLPEGALSSLVVDGVIAGVGSVVVFLPQILILFLVIGLLEDCGYMARAAFIMDRLMAKCGLSGKSFIPMLSGFACAVPAIMATRVIENRRDRIATILVTPLMSCSARLP
ncbi:MAG TPA: ferrous iron transport protein B, partial [Planctomycetota bacterium]|nr:ferrous iron transport protein B [Planctomycetota bacterium]